MKILIAIDGSPPSLEAARHALLLARAGLRTDFVLATVQDPTYLYERVLAPDAEVLERVTGTVGTRALSRAEELFKDAGVPYEREIGSGAPQRGLADGDWAAGGRQHLLDTRIAIERDVFVIQDRIGIGDGRGHQRARVFRC